MAYDARQDLVGLSRHSLVKCAGVPVHESAVGQRQLLTYVSDDLEHPVKTCVGTFVLRRNRVERLDFTTPAGRLPKQWGTCAVIVRDCMQHEQG